MRKKYYFLHRFTLDKTIDILYNSQAVADLAHLVERHLAKVEVASSSLVIRSILNTVKHRYIPVLYFFADVLLIKIMPYPVCKIQSANAFRAMTIKLRITTRKKH